jgi:hypothetical protein
VRSQPDRVGRLVLLDGSVCVDSDRALEQRFQLAVTGGEGPPLRQRSASAGFSFVLFALVVVAAGVVGSGLGDGDDVEGSVESSVAAAVEAMALCSAR